MVKIELKEIVSNHDNRRKALNAVERGNKKTNPQYPYYGANGIVDFIDEYIFDEELLCIAEDGGNWGYKQNCSYIINGKYWVNNHVHVLKPKKNVEIKYLMYYLNYTDLTSYITGTTRGKLTRTALDKIQINLPELEIQREIVIILDKIVTMIDKKKKQINLLEELVKSRFIEMFGDPIKNEKGWKVSNFGKNFEVSSGGTPSTKISEYWENGNISWIGSNLCQNKILNENDGKYITELGYENSSAKLYAKGTILIALVGATIGKTALLKFPTATNQNIAGVEVDNNKFSSDFVFFVAQLLYPKFQGIGKNKFKMANLKFIKDLPIIIPPLSLQNEFASFVTKTNKLKFEAEKSLKEMENLYESLMQKFFKQN